jgi:hypothetical protein
MAASSMPNSGRSVTAPPISARSIASNGSDSKRTAKASPAVPSVPNSSRTADATPTPRSIASYDWPRVKYNRTRVAFPLKQLSSSARDTLRTLPSSTSSSSSSHALSRHRIVGYNGTARHNAIWHPDAALLAYSSGQFVIIDHLQAEPQQPNQSVLEGHDDDITTMAISPTGRYIASASGRPSYTDDSTHGSGHGSGEKKVRIPLHTCQIRVWDTTTYQCIANMTSGKRMHRDMC